MGVCKQLLSCRRIWHAWSRALLMLCILMDSHPSLQLIIWCLLQIGVGVLYSQSTIDKLEMCLAVKCTPRNIRRVCRSMAHVCSQIKEFQVGGASWMCNWKDPCYFWMWELRREFQVWGAIARSAIGMIFAISNVGMDKRILLGASYMCNWSNPCISNVRVEWRSTLHLDHII
jgi:hypothetical protein